MNRQILRLAIPNIISNLTVPLLSSVDTAMVGHLNDIAYLGAIAVGGMIFNFIYWGFGFLRMGTTGLTAQAFGKKDEQASMLTLARAVSVAIGFSILLILLQKPIASVSLALVDASSDVERFALVYFSIRIYAAPATLGLYAFTGWFLGMQNARYPMILAIVTNLFNVFFDVLFVRFYHMNVDGVALGTVCANYLGLAVAVILFLRRYRHQTGSFDRYRILQIDALKKFFTLNFDIFIRTLILIFAFAFFTARSAAAGELVLAANTILINLWTIMSYGIDGFAFAAESLIGRFIGAGDRHQLKTAVHHVFLWGIGLGILFTLTFYLFDNEILRIFTNQPDVIGLALILMPWTIAAPVINSFCYIWDGIFIGATASAAMRNAMIICMFIFYLPVYYLARPFLGYHALWLALTVFMAARGVSLRLFYPSRVLMLTSEPLANKG
jgi:MATE family multidrug resistance protein